MDSGSNGTLRRELDHADPALPICQTAPCKVCGNTSSNKSHQVREMMFGFGDIFTYVECGFCGCIALAEVPDDLRRYYPSSYYSFGARKRGVTGLAKWLRVKAYFGHGLGIGYWIAKRFPRMDLAELAAMAIPKNHRILDVGCGSGKLLLELSAVGYKHLDGVDPFIEDQLDYDDRVSVKRCFLTDLANSTTSRWDLILFNHSFEHVGDPLETLQAVARLLTPAGVGMIRIPVVGYAWEEYGTSWVQLDAPRHLFLHTEKSIGILAQKAGLRVKAVQYDSCEFQFWGSELYKRGMTLFANAAPLKSFSSQQLREFKKRSDELNAACRGDQAAFFLSLA